MSGWCNLRHGDMRLRETELGTAVRWEMLKECWREYGIWNAFETVRTLTSLTDFSRSSLRYTMLI